MLGTISPIKVCERVNADMLCRQAGLVAPTFWDWVMPWRAVRKLHQARLEFAEVLSRLVFLSLGHTKIADAEPLSRIMTLNLQSHMFKQFLDSESAPSTSPVTPPTQEEAKPCSAPFPVPFGTDPCLHCL